MEATLAVGSGGSTIDKRDYQIKWSFWPKKFQMKTVRSNLNSFF